MTSLLDQSALGDLAERLVAAARRAGADAADAVAVRSMSSSVEVRQGEVEASERAEGDDQNVGVQALRKCPAASISTGYRQRMAVLKVALTDIGKGLS